MLKVQRKFWALGAFAFLRDGLEIIREPRNRKKIIENLGCLKSDDPKALYLNDLGAKILCNLISRSEAFWLPDLHIALGAGLACIHACALANIELKVSNSSPAIKSHHRHQGAMPV